MTTEQIIEMAKQAGFWQEHIDTWMCSTSNMEFFANLIRNLPDMNRVEGLK